MHSSGPCVNTCSTGANSTVTLATFKAALLSPRVTREPFLSVDVVQVWEISTLHCLLKPGLTSAFSALCWCSEFMTSEQRSSWNLGRKLVNFITRMVPESHVVVVWSKPGFISFFRQPIIIQNEYTTQSTLANPHPGSIYNLFITCSRFIKGIYL